ncbi:hypothetical protein [Streptomyces sp. Cmuel-A718b]|uniref:hypothetical protein n=1 Tax=Streptomyces sp. Cmuel-A718b TaxID=697328 RepID=UPI001EFC2AE9|nr:hypothetical protein [Streptomyces sp. Cmuel-A718b]
MTDETFAQRDVISSMYYNLGIVKGKVSKSITNEGIAGQLKKDLKPLVTGDHNLATVGLGSYTTDYEVLRASPQGLQVRMTVRNTMTISSLARPAVGYGTAREKFVQRWLDNDGIIAFGGAGRPYSMEVTFRTVIRKNGYRGLGS